MSWPKTLCALAVASSALTLNPACAQGAPYTPTATVNTQVHHFHPRFARFEGVRAFGINNLDTRFAEFV